MGCVPPERKQQAIPAISTSPYKKHGILKKNDSSKEPISTETNDSRKQNTKAIITSKSKGSKNSQKNLTPPNMNAKSAASPLPAHRISNDRYEYDVNINSRSEKEIIRIMPP